MTRKNYISVKRMHYLFLLLMLGFVLYFGALNVSAAETYQKYVTASALNIRKKPSMDAKVVGQYKRGKKITCYGTKGEWTKVKYKDKTRYVATEYLSDKKPVKTYTRYVNASALNIRKKPSMDAKVVGKYANGTEVTCYGKKGDWTKVKFKGKTRYVKTQYLSKEKPASSSVGQSVVDYAMQFLGNPYKWGGASLTKGADCSGFTMAIFAHFGYSLPHSSTSQRSSGYGVNWSDKRPGDLICYEVKNGSGHVGIYIGGGQVIHASNPSNGIKISSADYRPVHSVRRIVD